ncbi:helix-turn-helix domain-containing protein [Haloarchaeobius amylolyticus]|uniref:helix-turn-helix domain-containing protein n=1 Tax=Haloarchaeobius amylolyticus TaxID=1198296 RepID=UPI002270C99E|nr:helix-turn-helix domain-containing protein [Haloarchaeobius amylolyticus]
MAIIAEVTIASDAFPLGQLTLEEPGMRIELERVVPTDDTVIPFFWAQGGDFEAFERRAGELESVDRLTVLDRLDDAVLYRVTWGEDVVSFVSVIADLGATILEAHGNHKWLFRLRFRDHGDLSAFSSWCAENEVPFELRRLHSLADVQGQSYDFGLTDEQREALEIAVRLGYYKVPKRATLADVSAKLDISEQATGERLRRAMDKLANVVVLADEAA